MTPHDFRLQLQRLQRKHGEKALDNEFAEYLWVRVKDLHPVALKKAVDELMGNHFRPPGADLVADLARGHQSKTPTARPYKREEVLEPQLSTWPRWLEYLMVMIQKGNTLDGFDYACRLNRVSEDEAWKLYELFVEGNYEDPFAKVVVARTKGRSFSSLLHNTRTA